MKTKYLMTLALVGLMSIPCGRTFAETDDSVPAPGEVVEIPDNPDNTAVDADGNPYPEGGPSGLYQAIEDKQAKLENDPDNQGLERARNRLRYNLEKHLEKDTIAEEELPDMEGKSSLAETGRPEKVNKPEKLGKIEKMSKPEKPTKPEKPEKPVKPEKLTKPEKPEKPSRPEKPAKPEKPSKPEKPVRPGN